MCRNQTINHDFLPGSSNHGQESSIVQLMAGQSTCVGRGALKKKKIIIFLLKIYK
jgi:hypothetical protein